MQAEADACMMEHCISEESFKKLRGITKVIVPDKNKKDLKEIHEEITAGIEIKYASHMDDVIKEVFED